MKRFESTVTNGFSGYSCPPFAYGEIIVSKNGGSYGYIVIETIDHPEQGRVIGEKE